MLSLLITSQAISQPLSLAFERLSIDQGLSQSVVYAIAQDSTGFLWIGTQDGLNRYDGYGFKVFKTDPADSTSLSDNWINDLLYVHPNTLWIATRSRGSQQNGFVFTQIDSVSKHSGRFDEPEQRCNEAFVER